MDYPEMFPIYLTDLIFIPIKMKLFSFVQI